LKTVLQKLYKNRAVGRVTTSMPASCTYNVLVSASR